MKRVIIAITVMVMMAIPAWSASTTQSGSADPAYLHVVNGIETDYFQFNEKGVYVPQTDPPAALKEGWIVLSGQEPVTIRGPFTTIVLQRESILTVGTTVANKPSYYLVAGSASFLATPPFTGTFEVSTPVGIYRLNGPGEMFVSSDYAELIFSLSGEVRVMNAITRQNTEIPPFTYLNLADPFLNAKQISRETYETLSINPDKSSSRALPSVSVSDGLKFKAPEPLFPVIETSEPSAPVSVAEIPAKPVETVAATPPEPAPVPLTEAGEQELLAKDIPQSEIKASDGLTLSVSIAEPAVKEPETTSETVPVTKPEIAAATPPKSSFDVYVVHTNDVFGEVAGSGIGYARLAALLGWGRELSDRHLVLDAGNATSGSAMVEAFAGEPVAVLLDMLGYDAIAPGPADYAYGIDRLIEAAKAASAFSDLKVLAANIIDTAGNRIFEPYGLFDLKGYTVGVIGVSIPPESVEGIEYYNDLIVSQAQPLVDEVAAKSDFVILLGNIGSEGPIDSSNLAAAIHGIDLIVDGAKTALPAEGKLVGSTLIVNAGERLSSVGVVQIQVSGDEVAAMHASRILADDVLNPSDSTLAAAYGVGSVPEDPAVAAYIASQETRYLALQGPGEPEPVLATVEPEATPEPTVMAATTEPVVETVATTETTTVATDPLAIKGPQGITGSAGELPESTYDWGVTTTFNFSRDGIRGSSDPKIGLSVNPFYNHNAFGIGLQAFFMTDGDLFDPASYDLSNVTSGTGTANTISNVMRFVDYVRYGEEGDPVYFLADDKSPINFGNSLFVDGLSVASGPFEEHLGLYGSARFGKFGLELFADDLYLSNWLANTSQAGGIRFSFHANDALSFGLSSLVTAHPNGQRAAYPALDMLWKIKNERKLGLDLFVGMATMADLDNFSIDTIWDDTGSDAGTMFPNFLIAGGLDVRTLAWNLRFRGAVQNNTDGLVSLGSFNGTNYSGERLLDAGAGIHYILGAEADYQGERFGAGASWQVPLKSDLSGLVALQSDASVHGDVFSAEATYAGTHFEAALGFRRVGFISAFTDLLDFSGGASGILTNAKAFIKGGSGSEKNAQPYLAMRYRQGLFGIQGEVSMAKSGASYVPRINLGANVTVGKRALGEAIDWTESKTVVDRASGDKASKWSLSGDLATSITRTFNSEDNHITFKPILTIGKGEGFSLAFGPKLSIDLDGTTLYSHEDSPFKFGTTYAGTFGKVFDAATDLMGLIDHLYIGSNEDTFRLRVGGEQSITMGPLVKGLTSVTDSTLQDQVALTSTLETKKLDIDLFVNNLAEVQLGAFRLGITPSDAYAAEIGLSAIGSLDLTDNAKRVDIIPGLDLVLPVVSKEKLTLAARGSFATMVGYDTNDSFEQMFYSSAGSFLSSFSDYIVSGGVDLETGPFSMALDLAMQDGALAYGMFNPLFIRERSSSVLTDLDSAWSGSTATPAPRSYTAAGEIGWTGKRFGLEAAYMLPLSTSFDPDTANDLLTLSGNLDLPWFDVTLAYARRGFASVLTDSSASIGSKLWTLVDDDDSALSAQVSAKQGPLTFSATLSTLAQLTPVAGSWNAQSVATTNPALTLGVGINLF